jgi:hypothetical protein
MISEIGRLPVIVGALRAELEELWEKVYEMRREYL